MVYEADKHGKNLTQVENTLNTKICQSLNRPGEKLLCKTAIKLGINLVLKDEQKGYTSYHVC